MGKIRPNVLGAILVLGGAILAAGVWDHMELATIAVGGVIALGKDIISSDTDKD
jgi:hypothetical protein